MEGVLGGKTIKNSDIKGSISRSLMVSLDNGGKKNIFIEEQFMEVKINFCQHVLPFSTFSLFFHHKKSHREKEERCLAAIASVM